MTGGVTDTGAPHLSRGAGARVDLWRAALLLALVALVALVAWPRVERHYLLRAGDAGADALQLSVAGLRGALDRFAPLPALIAERPILAQLLADPDNPALLAQVNTLLLDTAGTLQASDVYLIDMTGLTLAASSYRKPLSFVGQNFDYRPYFTDAAAGQLARYFALGTTSGERGYFYAAPVWRGGDVIGVVALKFTIDAFEDAWRSGPSELMVTDGNGVVFMSSRPDWHFRTRAPLSPAALEDIRATRQYPTDRLTPLSVTTSPLRDDLRLTRIDTDGTAQDFVESDSLMADAGWRVHILTPAAPARAQAAGALGIGGMGLLLAGLAVALALSHRARILDRLAAQRETQGLLEARVRARTADLDAANASLLREVDERRNAETRLRITQKELVQAGKLAALGQMSAAISHEINQPLAAVKSYAENAAQLIDRARTIEARDNMQRISKMADRILSQIQTQVQRTPFSFLQKAEAENLLTFIQDEHPQTIALIICHLPHHKAAEILVGLPMQKQIEVIKRIANMEQTNPEVIREVEKGLESRLASMLTQSMEKAGGIPTVSEILNLADRSTEKAILEGLEADDPDLVEEIRRLMFVFEDVLLVDGKGIQAVLREVDNDELALALKTASEELQEKIFSNMSERAATLIKEDMEYMGPVRVSDVETAQQRIVDIVRRLEEAGEIIISGRGGGEELIV